MIECIVCGKEIDVHGEGYYAKGLDAPFKVYCMECNDKEFEMREPSNDTLDDESVDQNLMDACEMAKELMEKGLQPGLAIWKAAQATDYETGDIARELGRRKKRK